MAQPTGRRERKKERARQDIRAAAYELFRKKGYDDTRMEEIAEFADLSVGTLYNYFPSKGELLLSLIADSDDRYLREGRAMVAEPPRSAEIALAEIMVLATEHCVRHLGKSVWRHVSASSIANAGSTFGLQYDTTTKKHEKLVVDMLQALQTRGQIRQNLELQDAAHFLFSMKSKLFINFVSNDEMQIEQHREEVRQGVRLFLTGIQSGNERQN